MHWGQLCLMVAQTGQAEEMKCRALPSGAVAAAALAGLGLHRVLYLLVHVTVSSLCQRSNPIGAS